MLLDAKEWVKEIDKKTQLLLQEDPHFYPEDRAEMIAHSISRYIAELQPMLRKAGKKEEFLQESVSIGELELTIEEISIRRGNVDLGTESSTRVDNKFGFTEPTEPVEKYIPDEALLAIEQICNEYFEDLAGVVFDTGLPKQDGFTTEEPTR